mgnify:CR=1 FL=1
MAKNVQASYFYGAHGTRLGRSDAVSHPRARTADQSNAEIMWPIFADSDEPLNGWRAATSARLTAASRNPILLWLQSKSSSMRAYLDHLAKLDADLAASLRNTCPLKDVRRLLALTLFIDFSHEQGLTAGEVATLIGDAHHAATDAVNFLIGSALSETPVQVADPVL